MIGGKILRASFGLLSIHKGIDGLAWVCVSSDLNEGIPLG